MSGEFSIATDDALHREIDKDNRPKRIALAYLIGYSWEVISKYWEISVETAKYEVADFMRECALFLSYEILRDTKVKKVDG